MSFKHYFFFVLLLFTEQVILGQTQDISYVEYVNPFIGVADGDNSNCVIGPQLPFGSINPSPHTPNGGHDGYTINEPIRGFAQLHVSGTGWGKYGQVFLSPQVGFNHEETGHDSEKRNESANAYEYSVELARYNIKTSVVPSWHSAMYKFSYPKNDSAHLLLDLTHNIPMDIATYVGGTVSVGEITVDTSGTDKLYGWATYEGGFVGGEYTVYFYGECNAPSIQSGVWKNSDVIPGKKRSKIDKDNDRVGAYLNFNTTNIADTTVLFKVAVSFKSVDKAREWLMAEIPEWDYDGLVAKAKAKWNDRLGKIHIEADSIQKVKFYTALYHSMLMPRNRTADYPEFAEEADLWDDQYAIWDTWRTMYPLMMLIDPEMVRSNLKSFIHRFEVNGYVKDAYAAGNDMPEEQGGTDIDNIFADAYVKGLDGINWNDAYKLIKHNADHQRHGWQGWGNFNITDPVQGQYAEKGWIPAGIMSCSYTLEYAYNDYCAATIAKGLGYEADANKYLERSHGWTNLWNQHKVSDGYTGFIMPKKADGTWVDIDPKKSWGSWVDYFYEGSSWTYSYFMPHDIERLISFSPTSACFAEKLNYAFKNNLIAYSNEPAFLAPQLFHYVDRTDLASYWVRKNHRENYTLERYPGNDDSGAMSSWYVFVSMGLFPNAGQDIYYITGPAVDKAVISLENGNTFTIKAKNVSEENIYVQSCTLNCEPLGVAWITHETILNGGTLSFVMGAEPSNWGTNNKLVPQ